MKFFKMIFFSAIALSASGTLYALDSDEYVHFPSDESITAPAFFFWHDAETIKDPGKTRFLLTLSDDEGSKIFEKNVVPSINGEYFEFSLREALPFGTYRYTISCFRNSKESTERVFGAYRYPVQGRFILSSSSDLPARFASFPQWYAERHVNTIENGYNSLFFLSSGTACGALAWLMFTILDYNIVTRIIGYVFAASAATGYGASAYYCYRYFSVKNEIDRKYLVSRGTDSCPFMLALNYSW